MIKRHTRKSQEHPQGAIVEREGTIHISNVNERFERGRQTGRRTGRLSAIDDEFSHGKIRDTEK